MPRKDLMRIQKIEYGLKIIFDLKINTGPRCMLSIIIGPWTTKEEAIQNKEAISKDRSMTLLPRDIPIFLIDVVSIYKTKEGTLVPYNIQEPHMSPL